MGGFVLLLRQAAGSRAAFMLGWLFGVAHYTVTNNWIATAFTFQAEMPAALGWVAVPLLSVYLAVYPGFAALAAHRLGRKRSAAAFIWLFGACWIAAEWLKSWVFTGYAWGPFSLALLGPFDRPGLAAVLPVIGTYALSGVAVVLAGFLVLLLAERRWRVFALTAGLLAVGMYWPTGSVPQGTLPVTLVQPDLRQDDIDDPAKFEQQFVRIAKLSLPRSAGQRRLVLWPESAVPDYLRDGYPQRYYDQLTAAGDPRFARGRIGEVIGLDSLLLTGAVDLEIAEENGYRRAVGAYNAVSAIDAGGTIRANYYKAHLVPYGEYLALRWLLEPLGATRLVAGTLDFIAGPGPRTLDLGQWGEAGVQICYEIIFSGQVIDPANRPDYLFNPSNDGWFGAWGPPQHLAQARMRAAEEGLPVLRATTTGISAVISADGVVRHHIGMHRAERIDTVVPPAAAPTLFARMGHWLTLSWAVVLAAGSLVAMRRERR
jgi:apolipoprotein N-acyltransferase